MVGVRRKTELPLFELRSKDNCTGRKEDREGLTPMPTDRWWQTAVDGWRQPFVPFLSSCEIHNSSDARTKKRGLYSCERLCGGKAKQVIAAPVSVIVDGEVVLVADRHVELTSAAGDPPGTPKEKACRTTLRQALKSNPRWQYLVYLIPSSDRIRVL